MVVHKLAQVFVDEVVWFHRPEKPSIRSEGYQANQVPTIIITIKTQLYVM